MIDIAADPAILRKRVLRLFESNRLIEVTALIQRLSKLGEVLVFGGLLRDIAMYGVRRFYSDVDLVVDCDPDRLQKLLCQFEGLERNKFGGYRLHTGGWSVDIWMIRDTWAFSQGYVTYVNRDSILSTTITNWDAIAYSFADSKVLASDYYFSALRRGELELVLSYSPNDMGALIRVLRAISDGRAKVLMPKVLFFLKEKMSAFTLTEILQGQKSFSKVFFSRAELQFLRDQILTADPDLFGVEFHFKGRNYSLDLA